MDETSNEIKAIPKLLELTEFLNQQRQEDFRWSRVDFAWIVEHFKVQALSDTGFYSKDGDPENLKICRRGQQNERMVVESLFSLLKRLLGLNRIQAKTRQGSLPSLLCSTCCWK